MTQTETAEVRSEVIVAPPEVYAEWVPIIVDGVVAWGVLYTTARGRSQPSVWITTPAWGGIH